MVPLLIATILASLFSPAMAETDRITIAKPFGPSVKHPDPAQGSNGWYLTEAGVIETLFALNMDQQLMPVLAHSADQLSPLMWEITLKKNILFHDMTPMDAQSVKSSFDRLLKPSSPVFNKQLTTLLNLASIEKNEAAQTLIFKTRTPDAGFLFKLTAPGTGISRPAGIYGHISGTGPFVLEQVDPGEGMAVSRFEAYWGKRPGLSGADLKIIKNPSTRMLAFESGQVDIAVNFPEIDALRNMNHPQHAIIQTHPTNRICFLLVRIKDGPLKDLRIRKAVNLAINRQALVDAVLFGVGGQPGASIFPAVLPWHHPDLIPQEYNPEKAVILLREAGARDADQDGIFELNGSPLILKIWTYEGRAALKPTLELIAAQLKAVGIGTRLKITRNASPINQSMDKGQVHLNLQMWNAAPQGEPDDFISKVLTSNGRSNHMGFVNPELDRLAAIGRATFDMDQRKQIYNRIQEIVHEDLPLIVLFHKSTVVARGSHVKGFRLHPAEKMLLTPDLYIKAEP